MKAMSESIGIAAGKPFTVADLAAMPDDGRRHELIDGMLVVTPAPGWSHQRMSLRLAVLLVSACPPELEVLTAPFGVRTSTLSEVQPDVLVARVEDLTDACLPVAPLLAVEVLSPSTALHDHNTKKAHYERIGVQSYWVLDPALPGGLTAYELDPGGRYHLAATVAGEEIFDAVRPFSVEIAAARLLDGPRPA